MPDLVLGGGETLRRYLARQGKNLCFHAEEGGRFDLAAILPGAERPAAELSCAVLLLWEDGAEEWLGCIRTEQAVSCGFAPQNTLTPASTAPGHGVVTVQRELLRPDGRFIWPQDVPLPEEWSGFPLPEQLMLAGLRLLGAI